MNIARKPEKEENPHNTMIEERQEIRALCKAAFEGDHDMCRTILQKLPSGHINHRNDRGQTALYCAARNGHEEVIKLLLGAKDIDVNAQEAHGSTALHVASYAPHPNVLSLLLSYGCDTNIKNKALAEKELTAHDEARGGAIEVWTLFKTGGVKALTRKGFPVITRKSFKTASVKVRSGSALEKIPGPSISMGSGKDIKKNSRNSGKPQPRMLSTPSPIVTDSFSTELPSAPPADSEDITDLSDLVQPRRSNKKTPLNPNEEDSEDDDEIELSFTEFSGEEADHPGGLASSFPSQKQKCNEVRLTELWSSLGSTPREVQEQQIWVLYGEDCDAIPVEFNTHGTIADFKQFLCQNNQFPELAVIPLKNVNLYMKDERLDVRRKVGSYSIGDNLVVVKVNK